MSFRLASLLALTVATLAFVQFSYGSVPPPGWHQEIPNGPVSVDGIAVSGHLNSVSIADVRQSITAFRDIGVDNLAALVVISKDDIRGYIKNRDLGWFTARRETFVWPDRSIHTGWDAHGKGLPQFLPAMDLIKSARRVYVFPVANPLVPHRDSRKMRLLNSNARNRLIALLAPKENWYVGLYDLQGPAKEPGNLGFLFQKGGDQLVLFFASHGTVEGTLNGEHLAGVLNLDQTHKLEHEMDKWKAKYARRELATLTASPNAAAPLEVPPVDGVNVVGNVGAVSSSDLQGAMKAFKGAGLADPDLLRVIDKDDIRGYLPAPDLDLGWMTAKHTSCLSVDHLRHACWQVSPRRLPKYSNALHCIKVARIVYIFPVTTPDDPRLDNAQMRLLDDPERRQLAKLLGSAANWSTDSAGMTLPASNRTTNVGFKFLDGKDELILFFSSKDYVQGTFNGEYLSGGLDKHSKKALEKWKLQHAQAELKAKR